MKKKYWKSQKEYENEEKNEMLDLLSGEALTAGANRRDFLKLCGFSISAAVLASSCKRPVQKAIPYLIQPEQIIPGKALHYASSYFDGHEYASILVKTRDGRPIKIEANELAGFGNSGTTARVQASVLSLYDDNRYKHPLKNKQKISWEIADKEIIESLTEINGSGGTIALVTPTVISPTTEAVIRNFLDAYPAAQHIQYDPVSYSGMLEANRQSCGKARIPSYHFDRARVVVGFGADFLGTWLAPAHFTRQYAEARTPEGDPPEAVRHYQFESTLSVTGANADVRIPVKPSREKAMVALLYNRLAEKTGNKGYDAPAPEADMDALVDDLLAHRGASLVVCGSNDPDTQLLINGINAMLGNYGTTIDVARHMNLKKGLDREMERFTAELSRGSVQAVIFINTNPVYNHPGGAGIAEQLGNAKLTVALSACPDETADLCDYVLPDNHYLESWNDAAPVAGHLSLAQPVIRQLFDTRCIQESLLSWAGIDTDYYSFLKSWWEENVFPAQDEFADFTAFWNHTLQEGYLIRKDGRAAEVRIDEELLRPAFHSVGTASGEDELELIAYESIQLGDGSHANNPWLMELPDPVSKVSWDNYAAVSPRLARRYGLVNGSVIRINDRVELPVLVQPGQADNTLAVALGYGRTVGGKVAVGVGQNISTLLKPGTPRLNYIRQVAVEAAGKEHELALSQEHHSLEGRDIFREANLEEYAGDPYAGNHRHLEVEKHHQTLYPDVEFDGYHWGMAIDLTRCTGCSACVIGCQAENNIAVVGKDEVRRRRIMHWLRIDRYYSGDAGYLKVSFQPVMCQHCDNAPCENVCPVSATNHSNEGINQMSYNRCIGTKYCINNCPYRVRRFNWYAYVNNEEYDYHQNSQLGKMVLNPDVVVRERGVVEKCSFCVQRIQEQKQAAKLENRVLEDQEVIPACAQACPADAIVFGDLNDPDSKVSRLISSSRNYHLLEELHTLPSVGYLTKIRNT